MKWMASFGPRQSERSLRRSRRLVSTTWKAFLSFGSRRANSSRSVRARLRSVAGFGGDGAGKAGAGGKQRILAEVVAIRQRSKLAFAAARRNTDAYGAALNDEELVRLVPAGVQALALRVCLFLQASGDRAQFLFPEFLEEVNATKECNTRLRGNHEVILMRGGRWRNHTAQSE